MGENYIRKLRGKRVVLDGGKGRGQVCQFIGDRNGEMINIKEMSRRGRSPKF